MGTLDEGEHELKQYPNPYYRENVNFYENNDSIPDEYIFCFIL